jgi:hypothetical protein
MNRLRYEKNIYQQKKFFFNNNINDINNVFNFDEKFDINHVCSIGTLCHTASFLKKNNLKLTSYPFDWIFSNTNNILHMLEDDFKIFLDKKYYISKSNTECQHIYYYNGKNDKQMFNHRNPLINEDDYSYYIRCIDRFRNFIKFEEKKLYIIMITNIDNMSDINIKQYYDFNDKFSKYTNNYILLVIFNIIDKENNYKFIKDNNIHILELYTKSLSNGTSFKYQSDNIYFDNIIKELYNFTLS